jgi:hypothetical protein
VTVPRRSRWKVSFKASLHDEKVKGRETQFCSMLSTRAIYH